jgi:hypothetical protein
MTGMFIHFLIHHSCYAADTPALGMGRKPHAPFHQYFLRFSKGSGFLRPVPADGFAPSSAGTSKLSLERFPKMNPFRPSFEPCRTADGRAHIWEIDSAYPFRLC